MTKRRGPMKAWLASRGIELEEYRTRAMEYEATDEDLTATGGLGPILDLFVDSPLFRNFCRCLPERVSNNAYSTETFALILFSGFLVGYDCLDDLEHFQNNALIVNRFGGCQPLRLLVTG